MGVIIAFSQADGVLPTDMKDSKMIENGKASALEMFLTKVKGKPSGPQMFLFLFNSFKDCSRCEYYTV